MINKTAVRCLATLIAIFLAVGLFEYAHLDHAERHFQPTVAARTSPITGVPALSPSHLINNSRPSSGDLAQPDPDNRQLKTEDTSPVPTKPLDPVRAGVTVSRRPAVVIYVVRPGDTLWRLAAAHLGNPALWPDLFAANRGRHEPGGRTFVDPDHIYVGWTIECPALMSRSASTASRPVTPSGTSGTPALAFGAPAWDGAQ